VHTYKNKEDLKELVEQMLTQKTKSNQGLIKNHTYKDRVNQFINVFKK
jgi:hypothetical protein